jgi:hypothetical protein
MSLENVQRLIKLVRVHNLIEVKFNVSSLLSAQASRNVRKWMAFRHSVHQIKSEELTKLDWENMLFDPGGQIIIGGWHFELEDKTWTRVFPDKYLQLFLEDHSHLANDTILAFDGLCELVNIDLTRYN